MEWLLVIVMLTPMDDVKDERAQFATRAQCMAVAEDFVDRQPAFELRDRADTAVFNPVVRSYVECVPADGGAHSSR